MLCGLVPDPGMPGAPGYADPERGEDETDPFVEQNPGGVNNVDEGNGM